MIQGPPMVTYTVKNAIPERRKRAQNKPVYFFVFSMQRKFDAQIYFNYGFQITLILFQGLLLVIS
jgi:hypothetical protein